MLMWLLIVVMVGPVLGFGYFMGLMWVGCRLADRMGEREE